MPIYEYACMSCKRVVSRFVRNVSKDEPACPECCGADIHRVMSSFAMHLSMLTKLDQLDPRVWWRCRRWRLNSDEEECEEKCHEEPASLSTRAPSSCNFSSISSYPRSKW